MSGGTSAARRRLPAPLFLAALVGLATTLRLYHLGGESLWLDEAATWWNATRSTWLQTIFAEGNHSPLWWILTRVVVRVIGDSEFALRLPAAILGVVSVLLVWLLARALLVPERGARWAGFTGLDSGAPMWIALAAAIHPFWLEYSQEARMYSALLAETLGLSILLLAWLEHRRAAPLVFYAGLAAIALYTHPFAVLTLAAHAAFVCIEWLSRRRSGGAVPVAPLLLAQLAAGVLFLPWALRSASLRVGVATNGSFNAVERAVFATWRLLYGPSLATADRPRIDAGLSAFLHEQAPLLVFGGLLGALVLFFGVRALRRDPPALRFILTAVLVPFGVLLLAYARLPLLHEKYLIMTAPYLLLIAVVGARAAPGRWRFLLGAALAAWLALGSLAYVAPGLPGVSRWIVQGHPRGKDQWRDARAWVAQRADTGAVVVLYPSYVDRAWEYYDRNRLATRGIERRPAGGVPDWTRAPEVLLVCGATRREEREEIARQVATWMAADTSAATRGGVVEQAFFPRQWGVWTYEFVRGRPPARLPQ